MFRKFKGSNLMKHLMDNIEDNIYFKDRDGRITLMNQACAKWQGFDSPKEVIGKTDYDFFTYEHAHAAFQDEQRIIETGEPIFGKEEKETREDGRETWVSTSKMPLKNNEGKIVGTFGISRDITEQKNAAILAAKYAEENRQFREEMEYDLRMAAQLQKTYFPTGYPVFPSGDRGIENQVEFSHHHHPGGMVGGDFCSIRKLSDTEAGIFICDVMGHGIRAALGTASVRAMVEEISHQEKDPGQFLTHMNQVLMPILRQEDLFLFASAYYMVLDVSTGVLRYANAGHPRPIILSAESNQTEWLEENCSSAGPALAISEKFKYQTSEQTIHPGDSVLMFTDGLYEIVNTDQEEFGEERLLDAVFQQKNLPFKELFPSLINNIRQFSETGQFDDDVCLVGFHLSKNSI